MRKPLMLSMALCLVALSAQAFDLLPIHRFTRNDGKIGVPIVGQGWLEVTNDDWMPYIVDVDANRRRINVWPDNGTRGGRQVRPGVITYINTDSGFWTITGPARQEFNLGVRPGQSTAIHIQGFREGNRYGAIVNVNDGRRDIAATIVNPAFRSPDQLPFPDRIHYPYVGPPQYVDGPGPVYVPPPPPPPPYYPPHHYNPPPPPPPPPPYHHYGPVPPLGVPPRIPEPPSHDPYIQHRW